MKKIYLFLQFSRLAKQLRIVASLLAVICFIAVLPTALFAQAPVITAFSPIKGPVGTTVTITGTGFNTTAANNIVFFGATRATVTAARATSLTVTVPASATYAAITVLNANTGLAAYSSKFFLPTFTPGSGGITSTTFAPKLDFATGTEPSSVAIVDIDGDGKPDIVIANSMSNTVSVMRNTGSSGNVSFAARLDLPTGGGPFSMAVGDIDGDGKPDIVTSNYNSNTVSVLRNTSSPGNISFAAKVDLPTGTFPNSVVIVDIDGDGRLDLATANYHSNTVSVLRNTGNAGSVSFAAKTDFITASGPISLVSGDIDGDGKPDLVITDHVADSISVLRNTSSSGSISFASKIDFQTGSVPYIIAIGDIDGDGKPDLAVANEGDNTVSVLLNYSSPGSLGFYAKADFATGSVPFSVAIGDIDGDGKPDLAVTNGLGGANTVSVLRNTGNIGAIRFAAKVDLATGSQPISVAIGDINGNGRPDLIIANGISNSVSVLLNIPAISLPPVINSFTPASGAVGTSVTINGTGFNPAASNNIVFFGATRATVTAASATSLTVTVPAGATYAAITVLNTGTTLAAYSPKFFLPTFTPGTGGITSASFAAKADFTTGPAPYSVAIGDIDGDGKPDMVIANLGLNTVSVLRNTGSTGSASFAAKVDLPTGGNATSVAIGDIDGDGKPDLVVANSNASTVSVLLNTGSPGNISFTTRVDLPTGSSPYSVAISDIDGDGKPDIVVANLNSNTVSVLRNIGSSGSLSFAAKVDFPTGTNPVSIAVGDIDGDGRTDIVVADAGNAVSMLRNIGSPGSVNFAAKVDIATRQDPYSIAIGDIDGDGRLDLVLAIRDDGSIDVLLNTSSVGSISFADNTYLPTGSNAYSVAIGDLDGDGKPDIVVANQGSGTVSLLQNTCSPGNVSFGSKVDLATGSLPEFVAIGDLDGDGKPDLAVANHGSNTVSVFHNNTDLSGLLNLVISGAQLTPSFTTSTTNYTAVVANTVTSITVTPTLYNTGGSIKVNGIVVASGTASADIALAVGDNVITVVAIATDGVSTQTYTVTVNRLVNNSLANLVLSSGTLFPAFDPSKTDYTVSIRDTTSSIKVTPTSTPGSTITVNGTAVSSGTPSAAIPLIIGLNTITINVTSPDGSATQTYTLTAYRGASPNDHLASLRVTPCSLSPAFTPFTNSYTASVGNSIDSVSVRAVTGGIGASLTVNGLSVTSGTESGNIPLSFGANTILVVVTAQNGTTNTYTVVITRGSSNNNLASLRVTGATLSPGFTSGTTAYTSSVPNTVKAVQVTPVVADTTATVSVNGMMVASGSAAGPIPLKAGLNTITVVVTAQNSTTKTYTVSITKAPGANADIALMHISPGVLSPAFASGTTAYTAGAFTKTTSVTVTALAADPDATIMVNGHLTASGAPSVGLPLNFGANTITIVVTASDGVSTKTYTVIVTRALSTNADISYLSLSSGVLSPSFAQVTTSYTASVAYGDSTISFTPITTDPNATVTINGIPERSGYHTAPFALYVGSNVVTMIGTAQDGMTTKTYTITITRAAAPLNSVYQPGSVSNSVDKPQLTGEEITVHQGISPNGDGVNDFLLIEGITNYPDNTLIIMNRAGQVIFEAKNYDNSTKVFDGHSTKTGAMQLPGTYFYSLDYSVKGVARHKTGFIVLKY